MLACTSLARFDKLNPASHLVSLGMLLLESDYHELSAAWPDFLALCQTHLDGVDLTVILAVFPTTTLLGTIRSRMQCESVLRQES